MVLFVPTWSSGLLTSRLPVFLYVGVGREPLGSAAEHFLPNPRSAFPFFVLRAHWIAVLSLIDLGTAQSCFRPLVSHSTHTMLLLSQKLDFDRNITWSSLASPEAQNEQVQGTMRLALLTA